MGNVVSLLKGRVGLAEGALNDVGEIFRVELARMISDELAPLRDLVMALSVQIHSLTEKIEGQGNADVIAGLDKIMQAIESNAPVNVVKQIEASKKVDVLRARYDKLQSMLERGFVENIASDVPLFDTHYHGKNPKFTSRGYKIYRIWSQAIVDLAKIRGTTKEHYLNNLYKPFFHELRIPRLKRASVNLPNGGNVQSVFAAIIVGGYAANFTDYLFKLVEKEAQTHAAEVTK